MAINENRMFGMRRTGSPVSYGVNNRPLGVHVTLYTRTYLALHRGVQLHVVGRSTGTRDGLECIAAWTTSRVHPVGASVSLRGYFFGMPTYRVSVRPQQGFPTLQSTNTLAYSTSNCSWPSHTTSLHWRQGSLSVAAGTRGGWGQARLAQIYQVGSPSIERMSSCCSKAPAASNANPVVLMSCECLPR